MFKIEKDAIGRAVKRLQEALGNNLVAVAAFGSRVRGDFTGESDFDILVVARKRTFDTIRIVNNIFEREEEETTIPFSVVIKTMDSFDKEKSYNTTFYRNIKEEGIVFYGSA
jgi:predicted nucleotidyltransferase